MDGYSAGLQLRRCSPATHPIVATARQERWRLHHEGFDFDKTSLVTFFLGKKVTLRSAWNAMWFLFPLLLKRSGNPAKVGTQSTLVFRGNPHLPIHFSAIYRDRGMVFLSAAMYTESGISIRHFQQHIEKG